MIVPVILSGGSGTRLWPVSAGEALKQFLPLVGSNSMFRQTLDRIADRRMFAAPLVICGATHVSHVEKDLAEAGVADARIMVEPAARNTAPAIALAALACQPDAIMLVMPSDHIMTDVPAFLAAVASARSASRSGALATFGIHPSYPETGYGYIAAEASLPDLPNVYSVRQFVEKPPRHRAEAMLRDGAYYWNSGIFLIRAGDYLAELTRQRPLIASCCSAAWEGRRRDSSHIHPDSAAFLPCPSDSIDYAVMENAERVVVVPVDPGWSDVGGWQALYALGEKDVDGNVRVGHVATVDVERSYLRASSGKQVAVIGLSDLIVVVEGDNILVLPTERAQDVKTVAGFLAAARKTD